MSATVPRTLTRSRALALAVLCAAQLMVILDGTVVTVALPVIQSRLGFSPAGLAWVMNAYLVAFAGLLLLSGRLGDLLGSRRVFVAGLATFTAASLVCGLADSQAVLVAGRFAQGVGGALASAVILGMIVGLYPEPGEQARAMGVYSFVSAAGASVGLALGGLVTEVAGWHWAFLINVPIGAAALAAAGRVLAPARGPGLGRGADFTGALLVTTGLSLGVYAIVQSAEPAVPTARVLGYGGVALALLAAFVVRQARAATPLLPLRVLGSRPLCVANLVTVLLFAAGFGFQFLTALYLQRVLGYDSMRTGAAFLPAPVMIGLLSLFVSARLAARVGTRVVLVVGMAVFAAALLLFARAPVDGHYALDVLPVLALMGTGMGLAIPAVIMLAMSPAAPGDVGLASGLNNTAQQVGAATGIATLVALAAAHTAGRADNGMDGVLALRDGFSLAYLVAAGLVAGAVVLAAVGMRPQRASVSTPADRSGAPAPQSAP